MADLQADQDREAGEDPVPGTADHGHGRGPTVPERAATGPGGPDPALQHTGARAAGTTVVAARARTDTGRHTSNPWKCESCLLVVMQTSFNCISHDFMPDIQVTLP